MKPIILSLILTAMLSGAASLRAGEPPVWKSDCDSGAAVVKNAGGAEVLRQERGFSALQIMLGRWLGERYGKFDKVLWILGAFEPPGGGHSVWVLEGVNP
ncbi:MAG: hypothetical protein V4675_21470 [Verrucomicrobiota bacterium]